MMPNGKQTDLADQTISCVGGYIDKLKKAAGENRATWLVAQGFAWDGQLYPTYEETRFMAYNAIDLKARRVRAWIPVSAAERIWLKSSPIWIEDDDMKGEG